MNSKRSKFTAVMYWNFLRLGIALLYHIVGLTETLGFINTFSPYIILTLKTLVNIALSYVITADAEIVKNIEGKETKDLSKKKKINTPSKSVSTTSSIHFPKNPPRYSARTSHNSSLAKSNNNEFDDDKFTVSMKRLSFFEWANAVEGKRSKKNDEEDDDLSEEVDIKVIDEVKDKTNIEVVIDKPSSHSEKDNSQKKDEEIIDSTSIRDIVLAIDESIIKDNHSEKDDSQKKDDEMNEIINSTFISTDNIDLLTDEPSTIKDNMK